MRKKIPCVVVLNLVARNVFTLLLYIGFCATHQSIVTRSGKKNKHV